MLSYNLMSISLLLKAKKRNIYRKTVLLQPVCRLKWIRCLISIISYLLAVTRNPETLFLPLFPLLRAFVFIDVIVQMLKTCANVIVTASYLPTGHKEKTNSKKV